MDARDFEQQTRQAAERVGHLTEAGVKEAERLLLEMRDALIVRLASAPTDYGEWFYTQMLEDVERLTENLRAEYTQKLEQMLDQTAEVLNDTMDKAGLTLDLPRASRQTVEMLSGFHPGKLIGGLTEDARTLISNELRQAMLGVKTPWEVQQILAKTLSEPGPFGSIHARAEAIWVTEASRVFNTLAEERYKRVAQNFPDRFLKKWNHSGNTRHPRPHHVALGQMPPIGVNEKFLVGGYEADGPHDPTLPASEVIRCGCYLTMVMNPDWKSPETTF